jgi:hypothetical protein
MLICAMMIVASVPSFIISGVNKRKGMSISIKMKQHPNISRAYYYLKIFHAYL